PRRLRSARPRQRQRKLGAARLIDLKTEAMFSRRARRSRGMVALLVNKPCNRRIEIGDPPGKAGRGILRQNQLDRISGRDLKGAVGVGGGELVSHGAPRLPRRSNIDRITM